MENQCSRNILQKQESFNMELFKSSGNKQSLLDPRTKMVVLLMVSVFVLGGAGNFENQIIFYVLSAMPFVLLLLEKRIGTFLQGVAILTAGYLAQKFLMNSTKGILNSIILFIAGFFTRFVPSFMMGTYLVQTTTVSEFIAGMHRIHMPDFITIPLSVMFRFFPTIGEEFSSINNAMKMRDIKFGGRKALKMIEYRLIPMMCCCVNIGQDLSAASLTRGLGGPEKRTNICKIGMRFFDWVILIFCILIVAYSIFAGVSGAAK